MFHQVVGASAGEVKKMVRVLSLDGNGTGGRVEAVAGSFELEQHRLSLPAHDRCKVPEVDVVLFIESWEVATSAVGQPSPHTHG